LCDYQLLKNDAAPLNSDTCAKIVNR